MQNFFSGAESLQLRMSIAGKSRGLGVSLEWVDLTSSLSCFFFAHPAQGFFEFNSTTSCSRAPRKRAASPGDLRMDAAA